MRLTKIKIQTIITSRVIDFTLIKMFIQLLNTFSFFQKLFCSSELEVMAGYLFVIGNIYFRSCYQTHLGIPLRHPSQQQYPPEKTNALSIRF